VSSLDASTTAKSPTSRQPEERSKRKIEKHRSAPGDGKRKAGAKSKDRKGRAKPEETDPETEEIKKLQGWLVKCGIRKLWGKELKPYDTPKAKIKHLREMLADAGMTGRYSIEKATQIREARELQADLEAVQAGAKAWGKSETEDEASSRGGRPKRRLAKGLQSLQDLQDSDDMESD
jgi:hypothetical protein